MTRRVVVAMAIVVAGLWWANPLAGQGADKGDKYTARLGWVPITGQDRANVTGKGTATATLSGTKLALSGTFEGLAAPATIARLYRGVAKGARGTTMLADLTITKATSGTISGSANLAPIDLDALKQGKLYIQVHSEKGVAPDGSNLWGWLMK